MKLTSFFCAVFSALILFGSSGCVSKSEFESCVRRNHIQLERIQELEAALEASRLSDDQFKQNYDLLNQKQSLWQQKIDALNASLTAKQTLIDQLYEQLGQIALPPELSSKLADWAQQVGTDLVTFDEKTGIVRFKSDLLFEKGSDTVQANVIGQLGALAEILNSDSAQNFDVLVVGHTDDIPIKKAETLAMHPSNWHLSAHRAIAVQKILTQAQLAPTRTAVMGMGQYRPIEPNAAGEKGNPKNRRVEIYIVPAGSIHVSK
ncbi:MAG: OmpA family protein [Sedimentisphaerales bacterium]|nr:OmpA family protein [Sedimentisphaerales bacterium]